MNVLLAMLNLEEAKFNEFSQGSDGNAQNLASKMYQDAMENIIKIYPKFIQNEAFAYDLNDTLAFLYLQDGHPVNAYLFVGKILASKFTANKFKVYWNIYIKIALNLATKWKKIYQFIQK